jgi:1-pyrroline-5-carboxylate dehydrogenase
LGKYGLGATRSHFLKAAELIAGPYRARINAATMIAQSKMFIKQKLMPHVRQLTFAFQRRIYDQIYGDQPTSTSDMWNRLEYRPLEGFVYAITPFNSYAIAANLPASAAMMVTLWCGNQVTANFLCTIIIEVFKEAGVPDGVINVVLRPSNDYRYGSGKS